MSIDKNKVLALYLEGKSQPFRVQKERVVVGSVSSADVRLSGDGVSPIHAVIELVEPEGSRPGEENGPARAIVYDLASDTGLFVNGQPAVTQELKAGDTLTIGRHKLKVALEDVSSMPRERLRVSGDRKLFVGPPEELAPLLLQDARTTEPIFDHRPSMKPALEAVMSWRGTILDIEHFVAQRHVTIGPDRRNDFGLPPVVPAKRYAIIERAGDTSTLSFDANMKGVVQKQGSLRTLEQLRAAVPPGAAVWRVPLGRNDFAKVRVGDVDFYFSHTAAPPTLKRSRIFERDPFLLKILLASFAFSTAAIVGVSSIPVPQSIEAEQLPERIATILYQPERYQFRPKPAEALPRPPRDAKTPVTPPKPQPQATARLDITPNPKAAPLKPPKELVVGAQPAKPVPVAPSRGGGPGSREAKEGAGARAKGTEGQRGTKTAQNTGAPQNAARRPSPQGGAGRGGDGKSQVPDRGNVDVLKDASAKFLDLLGNSANQLGKGGSKVAGFGAFNTQGQGGLALSGDGRGGGGTADTLAGGLADRGDGGGRVGTGKGAIGNGEGIVGGKARVAIRSGGPEEAVVMGAIDSAAVEAALLAHRDEFRNCYEREINAENPKLAGRVGTSFVIGSTGRVTRAGLESTTLKNANVERCILNVIRRIDFPIPRGAGVVQVTYPFKFQPLRR